LEALAALGARGVGLVENGDGFVDPVWQEGAVAVEVCPQLIGHLEVHRIHELQMRGFVGERGVHAIEPERRGALV
jgi:hypothetical protein